MIEVVFSDSEKDSMKIAKNYNEEAMRRGISGYIGRKPTKDELEKFFEGQAVGGDSRDVVSIGFSLDIGDISGSIDGVGRQNVYSKLWSKFSFENSEQEQFFLDQREDIEHLLVAAKSGTPVRIWKSKAPYSICGYYFVCNLLRNIDCDISVISLPDYQQKSKNEIIEYSHWGEVEPGKFYQFLPLKKQLTKIKKDY